MLKGFKDFVLRGNVMDLAVAVVIGVAFKAIVDAFVVAIVNPLLGLLVGKPNFDDAFIVSGLKFGMVLTAVLNFVLIAAVIYFILVVPMNRLMAATKKKEVAVPEPPPLPPTESEKLLAEIRDLLKKNKG
ncbi:MAG: mechanosensitive ion channel protein MscL [Deltaproteobacteria bacterium CG2_30_63_29]|nr:MAG: mechanosensitive ion channel protein MscL [Deltaproteobacteria bacterium CG2_30_63_29]